MTPLHGLAYSSERTLFMAKVQLAGVSVCATFILAAVAYRTFVSPSPGPGAVLGAFAIWAVFEVIRSVLNFRNAREQWRKVVVMEVLDS